MSFSGNLETAYRACLWSRIASRVVLVLSHAASADADELYEGLYELPWENHIALTSTFAVDAHGTNNELRNTQFIALRAKDAVCDRLQAKLGARPSVETRNPDVTIVVRVRNNRMTCGIDLSGDPLFRRGTSRRAADDGLGGMRPDYAAAMLAAGAWHRLVRHGSPTLVAAFSGSGTLVSEAAKLEVTDTKGHNGLYAHVAKVFEGTLHEGDVVTASIDVHRRELIRRNHTATHLLDAALKSVLGEHVNQAGSLVDDGRLRFDFTHFEALTAEQLHEVEDLVNVEIFSAKPVVTKVCGIEEAKAAGAVALFGEKYGDVVRMVSCGGEDVPFSRELCGGTHARNTSELGLFKIVSESSTGSNVRRIEAVTSLGALAWLDERNDALDAVAAELKCRPEDAAGRIADIKAGAREAEAKLKQALLGGSSDKIQAAMGAAIDCGSYKAVIARMDGLEAGELREAWDAIRDKANGGDVACFLATTTPEGKVALLAAATDGAVKAGFGAGDVIRKVAEYVGGRGGGRPNMAQAGGKDAAGIKAALAAAREMLA